MKDIKLVLPIIVRESLTDMCPCHRELAERLLRGEKAITSEGKIRSSKFSQKCP